MCVEAVGALLGFFEVAASSHDKSSAFNVGSVGSIAWAGGGRLGERARVGVCEGEVVAELDPRLKRPARRLVAFDFGLSTFFQPCFCSASADALASWAAVARDRRHSETAAPRREKVDAGAADVVSVVEAAASLVLVAVGVGSDATVVVGSCPCSVASE